MSAQIVVRKCDKLEEFHRCVDLQREIWHAEDLEVRPVAIYVVAARTGGQVLGAFDGDRMVGFTLAMAGLRNSAPFLHSHMTGVLPDYCNRGIGRLLKLYQREEALGRGIRLIEWTFDPLETRNAHFNLNRLGAICRQYHPNLYGLTTSLLHLGLPTDRLLAEWHLDSGRVLAAAAGFFEDPVESPATIELPADLERWKNEDMAKVESVQTRAREEFTKWFAKNYAAVAVRISSAGAAYLLAPWSDF